MNELTELSSIIIHNVLDPSAVLVWELELQPQIWEATHVGLCAGVKVRSLVHQTLALYDQSSK